MKIIYSCWIILLALFGVAGNSVAQPALKAGLWEHSFELSSQSGRVEAALAQAKQMLAALPPEQRQLIEKQMAGSGLSIDLQNYTAKVCITADQAAANRFPEPSDNCTQSVTEQNDDLFKIKFRCDGNPPVSGTGEMRLVSDKEYRGTVTINSHIEGEADQMTATQTGIWLSEDCS